MAPHQSQNPNLDTDQSTNLGALETQSKSVDGL
jgi:hypothetical protein